MSFCSFLSFLLPVFISCVSTHVSKKDNRFYEIYLDITSRNKYELDNIKNDSLKVFVENGRDTISVEEISNIFCPKLNNESNLIIKSGLKFFTIKKLLERLSSIKVAEIKITYDKSNGDCILIRTKTADVIYESKISGCTDSASNLVYINNIDVNYNHDTKIFNCKNVKINNLLNKRGLPNVGKL